MYAFEQQIRVKLEFKAMEAPVEVSVPFKVLHYLDTHADRWFAQDGSVVYSLRLLPDSCARLVSSREPQLAVA